MSLVSTEWLEKNLENVRVIDASWHMPISNRNAYNEYLSKHIGDAVFFNLDKSSDEIKIDFALLSSSIDLTISFDRRVLIGTGTTLDFKHPQKIIGNSITSNINKATLSSL